MANQQERVAAGFSEEQKLAAFKNMGATPVKEIASDPKQKERVPASGNLEQPRDIVLDVNQMLQEDAVRFKAADDKGNIIGISEVNGEELTIPLQPYIQRKTNLKQIPKGMIVQLNSKETALDEGAVSFTDRVKMQQLRDTPARARFLRQKFSGVSVNGEGALVVNKNGLWHKVDPDMLGDGSALEMAQEFAADTAESLKDVLTVGGSLVGGTIGLPAGLPGVAVGSTLGAAGGSAVFNMMPKALELMGLPLSLRKEDMLSNEEIAHDAMFEGGLNLLGLGIGPVASLTKKGINKAAVNLIPSAAREKIFDFMNLGRHLEWLNRKGQSGVSQGTKGMWKLLGNFTDEQVDNLFARPMNVMKQAKGLIQSKQFLKTDLAAVAAQREQNKLAALGILKGYNKGASQVFEAAEKELFSDPKLLKNFKFDVNKFVREKIDGPDGFLNDPVMQEIFEKVTVPGRNVSPIAAGAKLVDGKVQRVFRRSEATKQLPTNRIKVRDIKGGEFAPGSAVLSEAGVPSTAKKFAETYNRMIAAQDGQLTGAAGAKLAMQVRRDLSKFVSQISGNNKGFGNSASRYFNEFINGVSDSFGATPAGKQFINMNRLWSDNIDAISAARKIVHSGDSLSKTNVFLDKLLRGGTTTQTEKKIIETAKDFLPSSEFKHLQTIVDAETATKFFRAFPQDIKTAFYSGAIGGAAGEALADSPLAGAAAGFALTSPRLAMNLIGGGLRAKRGLGEGAKDAALKINQMFKTMPMSQKEQLMRDPQALDRLLGAFMTLVEQDDLTGGR